MFSPVMMLLLTFFVMPMGSSNPQFRLLDCAAASPWITYVQWVETFVAVDPFYTFTCWYLRMLLGHGKDNTLLPDLITHLILWAMKRGQTKTVLIEEKWVLLFEWTEFRNADRGHRHIHANLESEEHTKAHLNTNGSILPSTLWN